MKYSMVRIHGLLIILQLSCLNLVFGQLDVVLQTGNQGNVTKVEIHPTQPLFLSLDQENNVVVWDLQLRKQFSAHQATQKVSDVCFINDSVFALAIGDRIEFWNFTNHSLMSSTHVDGPIKQLQTVENGVFFLSSSMHLLPNWQNNQIELIKEGKFDYFKCSENGKYCALQQEKRSLIIDLSAKKESFTAKGESHYLHISEKENYFARCQPNSSISGYSLSNYKKKALVINSREWNNYSVLSFYKEFGVAGDKQGIVSVFNLKNGRIVDQFKNNSGSIHSLDLDTDRGILLIGAENGTTNYYDLDNHEFIHAFSSISPTVNSIKFLNESLIVLGYSNSQIKIWDLKSHEVQTAYLPEKKLDQVKHVGYQIIVESDSTAVAVKTENSILTNKLKKTAYNVSFDAKENEVDLKKRSSSPSFSDQLTGLNENLKNGQYVYQIEQNGIELELGSGKQIVCSEIAPNGKNILAASSDGFLYWINAANGEILLKMCSPTDNGFFYMTKENHYFASKKSLSFLGARYQGSLIGFEQIDLIYNRPDKVLSQFDFNDEEYVSLLEKAYNKRIQKLGINAEKISNIADLPVLESNVNEIPLRTNQAKWNIKLKASSNNADLKAIHILINGSPIGGKNGMEVGGNQAESTLEIELSSGKNKIQLYAENEVGLKSIREEINVSLDRKADKELYMLTIGSGQFKDESFNLNYAEKDADDIRSTFLTSTVFSQIHSESLMGKDVTSKNIFKAIDQFKKAKVDDVIIIFFAGHGVLDPNLDYYLSTSEMDFTSPKVGGLKFDDFENELGKLNCRNKVLFIDACHSGELDKDEVEITDNVEQQEEELLEFRSGTTTVGLVGGKSIFELSKNLFVDLRENNGVVIISSAGAAEYALEGSQWKNGAFTYCILSGLNDLKADANKDKKVSLNELQAYLFEAVPKLTNGKQTPTSRVEILEQDLRIW